MHPKTLYYFQKRSQFAQIASIIVESDWKGSSWENTFNKEGNYRNPRMMNEFVNSVSAIRYFYFNQDHDISLSTRNKNYILSKTKDLIDPKDILDETIRLINDLNKLTRFANDTTKSQFVNIGRILDNFYLPDIIDVAQEVIDNVVENSIAYDFINKSYIMNAEDINYETSILTKDILKSLINIREFESLINDIKAL